jgi:hypothetical protein
MCGSDPEPNLHPEPREMGPAGHPLRKIAKRIGRKDVKKALLFA